jgi:predicted nucleotidyltransferase
MPTSPIAQTSTDQDAVLMRSLAGQSRHPRLGQIAIALRDNLLNIYGDRLAHLILFGSQARGDAQPDSDLDVLIVLRDQTTKIDRLQEQDRTQFITDLCLDYELVICPIFWLENQLDWEHHPLLKNIRADGISLINV